MILHVVGLWVTSPPDVIDALLFWSPTPFSFCGVVAMWAVFASALMAPSPARLASWAWMTATPPLPEVAQAAAQAQGGQRYDRFLEALGRRLASGPKLRQEVPGKRVQG